MISNRGVKVWPGGHAETFCSDHWRCRFLPESEGGKVAHAQVVSLLGRIANEGYDFIKTEGLYTFDGERGFRWTRENKGWRKEIAKRRSKLMAKGKKQRNYEVQFAPIRNSPRLG